jgi:hypothetical protein
MRRISSNFVKAHSDLSISHVNKLANSLWKGRTFEEKILAISILNRFHRVLDEHTWRRMDMSIRRRVGRYVIHLDQAPSAMPHMDRNKIRDVLKLRECWKRDRRRAESFLMKHAKGMPSVTITVATERAPKAFREKLRSMS